MDDEHADPDPGVIQAPGEVVMTRIQGFGSEESAKVAARLLVEQGVGATVVEAGGGAASGPGEPYEIRVLPFEAHRAAVVLGLEEPEDRPEANPVDPMTPVKAKVPWRTVLIIWAIAAVVVPLVVGFLVFLVMTR